jgi:hypothetical protein
MLVARPEVVARIELCLTAMLEAGCGGSGAGSQFGSS